MYMESNFLFFFFKKKKKKNCMRNPSSRQKLILYDPSINFLLAWASHYKLSHEVFLLYQANFCFFSQENTSICTAKYLEAEKRKNEKEKEKENGKCLENTWKAKLQNQRTNQLQLPKLKSFAISNLSSSVSTTTTFTILSFPSLLFNLIFDSFSFL